MRRRMNLGLWSRESNSAQLGRASKYTIETLLPGCEDVRSGALSARVAWGGWFPGLKPWVEFWWVTLLSHYLGYTLSQYLGDTRRGLGF
jgi:hypothetical protein